MNFWNNLPKPSLHPFTIITIMTLTTTITQPFTIHKFNPPIVWIMIKNSSEKTTSLAKMKKIKKYHELKKNPYGYQYGYQGLGDIWKDNGHFCHFPKTN